MAIRLRFALAVTLPCLLFAACGGGGGGGIVSAPAPVPSPVPTSSPSPPATSPSTSAAVTIFPNPTPQDYASLGASTRSAGDGYTPVQSDSKLTDVSLDASAQAKIRYTAAGYYEVQLPGAAYDRLIHYKGLDDPTPTNNFFQPASSTQNRATFITRRAASLGFSYTELASWSDTGRTGYVAFGSPTPAAAIPVTGTATYKGVASGNVDLTYVDNLYGGYYFTGIDGYTTLDIDFGRKSLTGSLELYVPDGMNPRPVGTYSTLPIPLVSGTNAFAGKFNTSLAGFNQFKGLFTGPAAQEAMGGWALPLMIDGQPHQALGAWIARREN
jgi:hypothetical protein